MWLKPPTHCSHSALARSTIWQPIQQSPINQNNQFSISLSAAAGSRYFRLSQPLTRIASTSPVDQEQGVSVNRETIVYFSRPLAPGSAINTSKFFAGFAGRKLLGRVELSSDRRKASLFYLEPVPGSTRVNVVFDSTGLKDESGNDVDADGDGVPGGIKLIQFDTYSTTAIPGTSVIGHIYASERVPDGR